MSHTPGPWTVVHYEWKNKGGGDFVGRIEGPNGEKVYRGAASFHAISNLANARLIAAAPEMHDACEADAALWHHYKDCPQCGPAFCPDAWVLFANAELQRDSALAKARGESNA